MAADNDSSIAWHRAQLKKNREALKALETARFTMGEIAGSKKAGHTQKAIAELKRKIGQSEQVISNYEKQTMRPRATDLRSLARVRWSSWNARDSG
jgi:transcriptional regulator with XRE-family HTH domain